MHLVGYFYEIYITMHGSMNIKNKVALQGIYIYIFFFFAVALRPNAGHGLLILEVSRSHTATHHSQ